MHRSFPQVTAYFTYNYVSADSLVTSIRMVCTLLNLTTCSSGRLPTRRTAKSTRGPFSVNFPLARKLTAILKSFSGSLH
jgi:hypothetical protein